VRETNRRKERNLAFRKRMLKSLGPLEPVFHGDLGNSVPHTINLHFRGIDSEALMVGLKDLVAVSNGSACTSHSYSPSHVLTAMGLGEEEIAGAVRFSWCHLTPDVDWEPVVSVIQSLR
jgi:cysteine desulfurase